MTGDDPGFRVVGHAGVRLNHLIDIITDEDRKRAQQIATAVNSHADLLAALQGIVDGSFFGHSTGYFHVTPSAIDDARAALKKAQP